MSSVDPQDKPKPLLVTGTPRSGTTWVGAMLALSGAFDYLYEPFNPQSRVWKDAVIAPFTRHFVYVNPENDAFYEGVLSPLLGHSKRNSAPPKRAAWPGRLRHPLAHSAAKRRAPAAADTSLPALVKDPIALPSAEWLARRFDMRVVALVRHPAAFVASMRRLGWGFAPQNWALSQPALLRDLLEPYRGDLERLSVEGADTLEQLSLMWTVLNHVLVTFQARNPDWIVLRHEDLSREPVPGFEALYERCGLSFSDGVRRTIAEYSSAANPAQSGKHQGALRLDSRGNIKAWLGHLSREEIARIRDYAEPLSSRFYAEADWVEDPQSSSGSRISRILSAGTSASR